MVKNDWSYPATPPYTFMTWTDTTAPLFHLLIFIKRLFETFATSHTDSYTVAPQLYCCTTAILLHCSYIVAPQLYRCTTAIPLHHSYTVAPQLYCCTTAIQLHHSYTVAPQLYCCTTAVLFDEIFLFSHL
jgi:hypothetical protein